ncbi:antitermination protein [Citrobacter freundii]|uniref:antitermination protein Q n=1 Tax=Citrobacter freundii TaxID=546 RepID=UPI00193B13D9|nr:antitermination protein [Citrobacter freundii]MBM3010016.1 antitermination protein [Citrobacter freundii]
MKLEALPKFYAPKTPNLGATAPATGGERMTISDVMGAQGFVQSKAPLGFALFLAKAGIQPPEPAIEQLAKVADDLTPQCDVIHFLPKELRDGVLHIMATMAYQDYSRSAASVRPCECCNGDGFIDADVITMKTAGAAYRQVREVARLLCRECKGKRVISNACRCHGKGVVLDASSAVPAWKKCDRCQGRGYSRLKFSAVLVALQRVWPELKKTTAYNEVQPFFEMLVTCCYREEAAAERQLQEVTR